MTMKFQATCALFLSLAALCGAEMLVNYEPRSQITDIAAIDLDQQKIIERAGVAQFVKALNVYREGGHSGSYAELTLIDPEDDKSFKAGTSVLGSTEEGGEVFGEIMEDVSWGVVNGGNQTIRVRYAVSDVQSRHVDCQVGALYTFGEAHRAGCLQPTGQIQIVPMESADKGSISNFQYAYDPRLDNDNDRTIQMFSTEAIFRYRSCSSKGCYYDDYEKFTTYYGDMDYGDIWVNAAAKGNKTNFNSGRGNADFALMAGNRGKGRVEAFTHGTVFFNIWMEVIFQMESAITNCKSSSETAKKDAIHAWDSAVAYYAGSLEGQTGSGDGYLLYALADVRSREFKTAGYLSDEVQGTSYANLEVVHLFGQGQSMLLDDELDRQCEQVTAIKESIVNLMKVPLIQTIYRYAWKRHYESSDEEKHEAKGASYTASLLPYVFACKPSHATFLYNQMKVGSKGSDINFPRLKETLEELYDCLGVTCAQVGGIYKNGEYMGGADPCFDKNTIQNRNPDPKPAAVIVQEKDTNVGVALGVSLAVLMVLAILGLFCLHKTGGKRSKSLDDVQEHNIAAVTAVSEVDMA